MQEGIRKPNRTGRTEPNRTVWFWNRPDRNRTQKRTEPNRTEPRCVRTAGRTGKCICPYRTEPNRMNFRKRIQNRKESNRTGSFLLLVKATWPKLRGTEGTHGKVINVDFSHLGWRHLSKATWLKLREAEETHEKVTNAVPRKLRQKLPEGFLDHPTCMFLRWGGTNGESLP